MEASTPASSASGSGPRACRTCATSKAKCIFVPGGAIGDKCRRCNRLNKECAMQIAAVRKRQPRTATRVDQLEEKLDGIVSLLKPPNIHGNEQVLETRGGNMMGAPSPYQPFLQLPDTPSTTASLSRSSGLTPIIFNNEDKVPPDALLYNYRHSMAPQFPFVIVPDGISAIELAQTKPFLFKAIMMAASYEDKSSQIRMVHEIFQSLSTRMLLENERSFDLLQGLLVLMAWYHYHINFGRRLTLLLNLAETLIIDLGLSRTSAFEFEEMTSGARLGTYTEDIPLPRAPTLDESRAILGLHFMSSITFTFIKEADDPGSIPEFTEGCLRSIEQSPEYTSDETLLHLFKLQCVAEEIHRALPRHREDFSSSSAAPVALCMRTLQSKLDSFRTKLPLHLQQNPHILMHYHGVLTYLTETALSFPLTTRAATLHACLTSTHAFFSFLFSIPLIDWYKITYVSWSQMRHVLVVLYKLSNFESPDWDPSHVRNILDLSLIIDNVISQLEKILEFQRSKGDSQGDGFLNRLVPKLHAYKAAFERRRANIIGEDTPPSYEPTPMLVDDLMFGQLDDAFWEEIVNDWNLLPPLEQTVF